MAWKAVDNTKVLTWQDAIDIGSFTSICNVDTLTTDVLNFLNRQISSGNSFSIHNTFIFPKLAFLNFKWSSNFGIIDNAENAADIINQASTQKNINGEIAYFGNNQYILKVNSNIN